MRKLMLIFLVAGFTIVGTFVMFREPSEVKQVSTNQQSKTTEESVPSTEKSMNGYVPYDEMVVAKTPGTKILFFHASWCPQCRALEADIHKQGVPEGVTIFKVDYDNAQDLRKKYGVTLQTTVVKVNETGKLISKFTPYQKPTLKNALENL